MIISPPAIISASKSISVFFEEQSHTITRTQELAAKLQVKRPDAALILRKTGLNIFLLSALITTYQVGSNFCKKDSEDRPQFPLQESVDLLLLLYSQ